MGLLEILTVVFIILKLVGVINWNWFLVLLPEILSVCFYIILIFLKAIDDWKEGTIMTITSDDIIRAVIDTAKRNEVFSINAKQFIKNSRKYEQAWEDFKEYNSHARSVLLERFMV